jgi:flagellar hook-associated protein 2
MAIQTSGLASGIDTKSLISSLINIEKMPIQKLQVKKSAYNAQLSAISSVKSALTELKTNLKTIDTKKEVLVMKGTSSSDTSFTATATGDAAATTYDVTVDALAVAEKNRSTAFASSTDTVTAGTISFKVKGGAAQDVTIAEGATLLDVAAAINADVTGATASIINDGTSSYLSITADESGHTIGGTASNALAISETYTGVTGSALNLIETKTASNAKLTIDGLIVESESNAVQNAVTGLTITAKKVTTQNETLAISVDKEGVEAKVQAFVDTYNKLTSMLKKQTTVTKTTNRSRTLASDPTIRALQSSLSNNVISSVISLAGQKFDSLASLGITTSAGQLKLDSTKFQAALDANSNNVSQIFTSTDGLAARLTAAIDPYAATGGLLASRTEGINSSIKSLDNRIAQLNLRVSKYEQHLLKTFTSLETTISSIKEQGNYLASALS